MDFKKLAPWNWFKKEEEENAHAVPVRREAPLAAAGGMGGPFGQLQQEIDHIFDNFFREFDLAFRRPGLLPAATLGGAMLKPSLDIGADDKEYTITVEVPGVSQKDVSIEVANRTLTIRGEKRQQSENKDKNFYRVECAYGAFQRVLSLPDDADEDAIKAEFAHGVLTITIPRREGAYADTKQIPIK